MLKEYNLYCPKHGHIRIEVEKPPAISKSVYCPWCAQRLMQPDKDAQKKWGTGYTGRPNYVSEGAST